MAAVGPAQLQVAFEDVALYFTREEWELLSQPEKQLYRDQMLRNYWTLVSLGSSGSKPDLIHRIELGEAELWIQDAEGSRVNSGPESPSSAPGGVRGRRSVFHPGGVGALIPAREAAVPGPDAEELLDSRFPGLFRFQTRLNPPDRAR
nr:zinc finger protein 707-like isoform X2 [Chrysemys picta bellii]